MDKFKENIMHSGGVDLSNVGTKRIYSKRVVSMLMTS
jgi:hypothetical protein